MSSSTLSCAAMGSSSRFAAAPGDPRNHTTHPIVTGTSMLAVKFKGGIMMAGDTLGSYGSLARFTDVRRVVQAGDFTIVGADGDVSDFQHIKKIIASMQVDEKCIGDGITNTPQETWSILSNMLYHRRSKMNPLWNSLVVGGFHDGEAFLGTTDKIGTAYEADFVATGLGLHMALPIMRREWRADMSEAEARALLEACLKTLFYRDCRTINRISFARVTSHGATIDEPVVLDTEWGYKTFVNPSQ